VLRGWIDKDTFVGGVEPDDVMSEMPEADELLLKKVELREYGTGEICVTSDAAVEGYVVSVAYDSSSSVLVVVVALIASVDASKLDDDPSVEATDVSVVEISAVVSDGVDSEDVGSV
jgi:hypothetical protein